MRTTVTLEADAEQIIRRRMTERKVSFKRALNDLVREGHRTVEAAPRFETTARAMGMPAADLDSALRIAAELEDDELARRLETGR